ncbi:hypothetical protein ES705_24353 [subsurface metagenome]
MVGAVISEKMTHPPGCATGHFKPGGKMATIDEAVEAKIKKRAKWQEANPGISWSNPEIPEKQRSGSVKTTVILFILMLKLKKKDFQGLNSGIA